MRRTSLDAGVLITATRPAGDDRQRALRLMEEADRLFLTSPFVHLEVVPKAVFHKQRLQLAFYNDYFKAAEWYRDLAKIEALAHAEAATVGLAALDALHVAAAHLAQADEFITTEKPDKCIYRSKLVKAIYLFG